MACVLVVCIMHLCFLTSMNSIHVNGERRGSFGHKSCLNTSVNTLCHSTQQWPKRIDDKFAVTMDKKIYFALATNTESSYLFYVQGWQRCELFALSLFVLFSFCRSSSPNTSPVVVVLTRDKGWQAKFNLCTAKKRRKEKNTRSFAFKLVSVRSHWMDKNQRQKTKFNLTLLVHIVSVHAVWWCARKKEEAK